MRQGAAGCVCRRTQERLQSGRSIAVLNERTQVRNTTCPARDDASSVAHNNLRQLP